MERTAHGNWINRVYESGPAEHIACILSTLPKCNICLSMKNLSVCRQCFCAWGCELHPSIPEHYCEEVARGRIEKMNIRRGLPPVLLEGDVPNTPLVAWDDYFRQKMIPIHRDHPSFGLAHAITQDSLSAPMTIVSCLRNFISPPLRMDQSLVICFVGADLGEIYRNSRATEEILHWLHLSKLTLVFVGPDVPQSLSGQSAPLICCPSCQAKKRTRTCVYSSTLFHEAIHVIPKPDLCICQNSGLHDTKLYSEWQQSVQTMLHAVPVAIFTSYTEKERIADVAALESYGANVVHSGLNLFRSPIVEDDPSSPGLVFQSNHSVTVIDNRAKKR